MGCRADVGRQLPLLRSVLCPFIFRSKKGYDAAAVYIYQGKGIGVMADTTSRWFDGNAGGVACTFERENTGVLTYRFTRTANGWEYETFGTRPSYYDAKPIINAILNYIVTGNTTKEYNPS